MFRQTNGCLFPPVPHLWEKLRLSLGKAPLFHQVLFTDLDLDVNELGGNVSWEQPALDTSLITHYLVRGMGRWGCGGSAKI